MGCAIVTLIALAGLVAVTISVGPLAVIKAALITIGLTALIQLIIRKVNGEEGDNGKR